MLSLLDSPSFAAFIGAFSAFVLVMATDSRRNRRKRKLITRLLNVNQPLVKGKRNWVRSNRKLMKEENRLQLGAIVKFPVHDIRRLEADVLDLLNNGEKRALDAVCFRFEAIDELLQTIRSNFEKLEKLKAEGQPVTGSNPVVERIQNGLKDAYVNLGIAMEMADLFINKHYKDLLNKEYERDKYLDGIDD